MKAGRLENRHRLHIVASALMLVLLLTSISVGAFHRHDDANNANTCAICAFQIAKYTLDFDTALSTVVHQKPILTAAVTLSERFSYPFHTHVFASHAPPQFC